jgi:hypothetical protein
MISLEEELEDGCGIVADDDDWMPDWIITPHQDSGALSFLRNWTGCCDEDQIWMMLRMDELFISGSCCG